MREWQVCKPYIRIVVIALENGKGLRVDPWEILAYSW